MNSIMCAKKKGQVSLEYLILIAAFFSALLIIIPTINLIVNDFLIMNDSLLLKQISEKISEQDKLFVFLGDGSRKEFEFFSTKEILLKTSGKNFILSNSKTNLSVLLYSNQITNEKNFDSKFKIIIEKINGETKILFE